MSAPTPTDPATESAGDPAAEHLTERARAWAATMHGHEESGAVVLAHSDSGAAIERPAIVGRAAREEAEAAWLARGATLAVGAGHRLLEEEPDPERTCFERDRDRILHRATAFRRLAGKTQVFIFPEDHQRTRLTHALEVAQVATGIARACRLNVALTEAIALGHDCGHGPFGHASEDAFGPYLPGGYDHAVWGADVVLSPLNLCVETLDGIRNHSWSRPAPSTPEGEVVSWADRIAYVCHDFEDAVDAGIVTPTMLPELVRARCGSTRSEQLHTFISGVVEAVRATGRIGMAAPVAEALAAFRSFNYERIYMRPASVAQGESVTRLLRALVEFYADRPNVLPFDELGALGHDGVAAGSDDAVREAVTYVAGMTDRFAFAQARAHLGWDPDAMPAGVDLGR
jgi:dGTPase